MSKITLRENKDFMKRQMFPRFGLLDLRNSSLEAAKAFDRQPSHSLTLKTAIFLTISLFGCGGGGGG
jgi:hypothetical protein